MRRKYAKRQLTWFRKDQSIHWFHPDDYEGIMGYMREQPLVAGLYADDTVLLAESEGMLQRIIDECAEGGS